jgi:hypothetical protein
MGAYRFGYGYGQREAVCASAVPVQRWVNTSGEGWVYAATPRDKAAAMACVR